ncbi:HpcH/HpaI aldolase/citrate lyase family protein [Mycobacterium parascrofulaceum ATCC BAA-614]|uniref:HpcH/HpaI aldolase/citrate lyase family protein n=1 Tax=Mycobacterium parascrofulaceum ATCC BAA-614 TaxID=525368 RepID=D5P604_9MYCO|nr:CoA ester lyase [Mycobacterium parascrofulaceum]EFG78490.1 HpcH/HpaI aldolase/citrate lyase family protein [Mycobacterium parascrofulaceum ATCC BAA-614]
MRIRLAGARSLLFVPGDRPERFEKALNSGADEIVLDLEDAVAPEAKAVARESVHRWLTKRAGAVVRINGADTDWYADDVAMLAEHACAVMVPKAHSADHMRSVAADLHADTCVIALVETAAGVLAAREISATDVVARAAFGSVDLGAELGVDPEDQESLRHARSALVLACAAAGRPAPVDGVTTALDDDRQLIEDADRAARMGFGGKLCIHPRQVESVNKRFTPSGDEVAWARAVLDVADGRGVAVVDGRMVDKPVVDRARRIVLASTESSGG